MADGAIAGGELPRAPQPRQERARSATAGTMLRQRAGSSEVEDSMQSSVGGEALALFTGTAALDSFHRHGPVVDPDSRVVAHLGGRTAQPDATFSTWLRRWGLYVEVTLALTLGMVVVAMAPSRWLVLATLMVWGVGAFHRGHAVTTPLQRQLRVVASSALLPLALLALGVAALGVTSSEVRHSIAAVAVAGSVTALSRGLRWTLQAPVRVVVVGDRASVATSVARLPRTSNARVVGAVVVEEGLASEDVPSQVLGVTTYADLGRIADVVTDHRADLVVVDPGRAVSPADFRAMTWELEDKRVAVGVSGVIRSISPHRLAAGTLGRESVLDVRAPRQSRFVRGSKTVLDRLLGVVALVLVSPVLGGLMLAVRWDSPGPALFSHVRVGRGGTPFRVYKLRTMVVDADLDKASLDPDNQADQVLFKVRVDPRVTRLGRFLRRSSLDELPQLLNVVRGEMSLVGPRPHLPEEMAQLDEPSQRRQVVAPGITGLWQVSGRSDLSRPEASALDTYYADNWTLSGDLAIALRTVKAVIECRGAY